MTNLSADFATQIIEFRQGTLTDGDIEQLSRLIFDYVVCAYSGSQQPASAAMRKWAAPYDGAGVSLVVGTRQRATAPVAALVNGTTAHSYELDDTHDATLSHPGSVVISAALAVASQQNSSGSEFLRAVVAGYEAMSRVGLAANAGEVIEFGFHPTAAFGGFGAAAAAAALKGLPLDNLLTAWGHVLSMAAGSMQFSDETEGTAIKRVHAGYAAQQGVLAAEMSEAGIGAPHRSIEGKYGFLKLYTRRPRPELLSREADKLAIHNISFKPYACCRQFHSVIDALAEVTDSFTSTDIVGLTVRGPRVLSDQHMLMRPTSPMAAQYSLPFVVGATLEFGPTNFDAFSDENLNHEKILHWADMLKVESSDEIQAHYPDHFGSEVEASFTGGKVRTKRVLDSRGTPGNPFSWKNLTDKAENLTAKCRPQLEIAKLQTIVGALNASKSIRDLEDVLAVDVGAPLTDDEGCFAPEIASRATA
jgi:2-methylcitrate dehydratase PrpD